MTSGRTAASGQDLVRSSLPDARFFLFEANADHADALRATGYPYFISVLSSEPTTVEFYATGSPGDSYFRETTKNYAGVKPVSLHAETLDSLVERHELPLPDLINADVQGAELDVLRGGRAALEKAQLALLECRSWS
jgi:FkbM family methyltransferase